MVEATVGIVVSEPSHPEAKNIQKEDVFGKWVDHVRVHRGMVVSDSEERCPIFKDVVPYKSVTVVCPKEFSEEVAYWLEYVHGGDSISQVKDLPDGKIALRSDYMCW